jgi:hypothetical protein
MASSRTQYFRDYYNNRVKTDSAFYEKEKSRISEYIRKRFHTDEDFKARCKEAQKRYRQKCKEALKAQKILEDNKKMIVNVS